MDYNLCLKAKSSAISESVIIERFWKDPNLTNIDFERSREFLLPEIDFKFEAQASMLEDSRRQSLLAPHVEEIVKGAEELGELYNHTRGVKPPTRSDYFIL